MLLIAIAGYCEVKFHFLLSSRYGKYEKYINSTPGNPLPVIIFLTIFLNWSLDINIGSFDIRLNKYATAS